MYRTRQEKELLYN